MPGIFHGMVDGYKNRTTWPIRRQLFEINVTNQCNLRCPNCQACVGIAPSGLNIPLKVVERFVNDSLALGYRWEVIKLTGGEATLHPQLHDILALLRRYLDHEAEVLGKLRSESGLSIPACQLRLLTNGSKSVKPVLESLPNWVIVQNQSSVETTVWDSFESFNIAPIDTPEYKDCDPKVFRQGCMRVTKCGGGALGTDGLYYPCIVSYHIARVFKLDIGLPNLKSFMEASDRKLRDCLQASCQYCGFFKYPRHLVHGQETSISWQRATKDVKML